MLTTIFLVVVLTKKLWDVGRLASWAFQTDGLLIEILTPYLCVDLGESSVALLFSNKSF